MKTSLFAFFNAPGFLVKGQNNAQFVNTFIGTDGTGHTFPGPSMPFGMVQQGNNDCGQMSAPHILSSLGFYPVNPASNELVMGAPQIKKATLHLSKGKQLVIESKNFSETSFYNDTRNLNRTQINKTFIINKVKMNGGSLKFMMTKN
jgi:putative alpha-1,2-mannosidase